MKCPNCEIGKLWNHYSRYNEKEKKYLIVLACDKCYMYFRLTNPPISEIQKELDEIDIALGIKR